MKKILPLLLTAIIFASCVETQRMAYLQNLDSGQQERVFLAQPNIYKIKPNDILYIRIYSENKEVASYFNNVPEGGDGNSFRTTADQYINGFTVSTDGEILLPVLGKLNIAGLSLEETEALVLNQAKDYLVDATVVVKLLNFKVTVLGEVNNPGVFYNYSHRLTIFEILGLAGDITDKADVSNIIVIRPNQNGTESLEIDLTSKSILTSPSYYLLPNDVVYVRSREK